MQRQAKSMLNIRFVRFWRHLTPATLKEVLKRAGEQRLPGLAAEMAYNSILALFPAILAIFTVIGMIKISQASLEDVANELSRVAPVEVLDIIQSFVGAIRNTGNQGLLSLSFIASIWAASGAVSAAMSALDQIHRTPSNHLRPFWKAKLISLGLTLWTIQLLVIAAILLFVSDLIVQFAAALSGELLESGLLTLWRLLSLPVALGIVVTASAFLYRYGPSRWTPGTPILPGALLAAVFWAFFSGLFRLYVSQFGNYNRVYGAVGTFIVLLLWLQLSSLMMLIGAQLNVTVGEAIRQEQQVRRLKFPRNQH